MTEYLPKARLDMPECNVSSHTQPLWAMQRRIAVHAAKDLKDVLLPRTDAGRSSLAMSSPKTLNGLKRAPPVSSGMWDVGCWLAQVTLGLL